MARYIDAEALTAEFKRLSLGENSLIERIFADGVYAVIDTFPTADVVPESEVEKWKEINEQLHKEMSEQMIEERKIERKYVAREIFEDLELLMKIYTFPVVKSGVIEIVKEPFWCIEPNDFTTIKKKYTESEE